MDTVTLDGKIYIKAVKAADGVGYAPDYVGQLCRKGLLDAIILGKTWYVSEESLLAHKNSQSRTNAGITKRDVEKQKDALVSQQAVEYTPVSSGVDHRKRFGDTDVRYTRDTDELLPAVIGKSEMVMSDFEAYPSEEDEMENLSTPEVSQEVSPQEEPLHNKEYEDKDEYDPPDPEIEYPQEENYAEDQEVAVPIRKIQDPAPVRQPDRAFVHEYRTARERDDYVEEDDDDFQEPDRHVLPRRSSKKRSYRLVPVAILILIIFLVANVVLESTWAYSTSGQKKTSFHTTYHLASLDSILTAFKKD
ncbi:hypothetical protein HY416_00705 [Candidatus Kaiserbacteria bacterium]|nr:hypothetical protein [Candidatus Kaiserbacteria bacterium]